MCQAKTTGLGRLKINVNKLSRDSDALQNDVDKIWRKLSHAIYRDFFLA